jgi:hypothetical protein
MLQATPTRAMDRQLLQPDCVTCSVLILIIILARWRVETSAACPPFDCGAPEI